MSKTERYLTKLRPIKLYREIGQVLCVGVDLLLLEHLHEQSQQKAIRKKHAHDESKRFKRKGDIIANHADWAFGGNRHSTEVFTTRSNSRHGLRDPRSVTSMFYATQVLEDGKLKLNVSKIRVYDVGYTALNDVQARMVHRDGVHYYKLKHHLADEDLADLFIEPDDTDLSNFGDELFEANSAQSGLEMSYPKTNQYGTITTIPSEVPTNDAPMPSHPDIIV